MTIEVLSRQQKRQAIARGLSPYLSHVDLEKELRYWEEFYGDKPAFALNRFVNDICNSDELRRQRKEILRQVLHEMAEAEREVHSIPQDRGVAKDYLSSLKIAEAFKLMLQHIIPSIQAGDLHDFEIDLKLQLQQRNFGLSSAIQFDAEVFSSVVKPESYADFLTLIYEIYCDFYGPSRADYTYARAKEQVKNSYPQVDLHVLL